MSGNKADLIIIGAGPAGLTAAQYGARANLKVQIFEQLSAGGQALVIDVLENYPGNVGQFDAAGNVLAGVKSGYEFAMDLLRQAKEFGASFLSNTVSSIKRDRGVFTVNMTDGEVYTASSVIIATGAKPRLLDVPGEIKFSGKGVSYCAACDGNFFKNKKIFAIGGGDAACDGVLYLSRLTDEITLVHRRNSFRAQKVLVERTVNNPNIKTCFNTVIKEIKGDSKVKSVVLSNVKTGEVYEEETDAVFVFAGTVPQSSLVKDVNAKLDETGHIITDQRMATNVAGLYAAGDVRAGVFRQVVTAAADGAVAAHSAAEYIDGL
jgi:thioredoxin reductase (NADPH)